MDGPNGVCTPSTEAMVTEMSELQTRRSRRIAEKNEKPRRSSRIVEKNENIRVDVGTLQRHSEEALQWKKRNNEINKEAPRHSKRGGLFGQPAPAPSLLVFGQQAPAPAMGGGLLGGLMPAQPGVAGNNDDSDATIPFPEDDEGLLQLGLVSFSGGVRHLDDTRYNNAGVSVGQLLGLEVVFGVGAPEGD